MSLPCISLTDMNKNDNKPFEWTSYGTSCSPLKIATCCELFLNSAADLKHTANPQSAISCSGPQNACKNACNNQPSDVDLHFSPRHILCSSTNSAQIDYMVDTCNKSVCNHIDPNYFDINSNIFTNDPSNSSKIELSLTQTIQNLLPYKYLITVPGNYDLEITKKTLKK